MAGLHFSCGKWLGDDKSANSLFDIIPTELEAFITDEEKPAWRKQFLIPFNRQRRSSELKLTPAMMRVIAKPLRRYQDALVKKLGLPDADTDPEDWNTDDAWRLYCVRDLLRGNKVCQRNGKPIIVVFA
jgi:hypothetical protein